eukprot:scaffold427429_cov30-Prasinocladus_malaysianus.AAC.1
MACLRCRTESLYLAKPRSMHLQWVSFNDMLTQAAQLNTCSQQTRIPSLKICCDHNEQSCCTSTSSRHNSRLNKIKVIRLSALFKQHIPHLGPSHKSKSVQ